MKTRQYFRAWVTIALCALTLPAAFSQQVELDGQSELYYDSERNVVVVTASTTADYDTQYYYVTYVNSTVFEGGEFVAWYDPDPGQPVYGEIAANAGQEVTVWSSHALAIQYTTYDYQRNCYDNYDDAYGYDLIAGTGDPTVDNGDWNYWAVFPPILDTVLYSQVVNTVQSGAKVRPPGNPYDFDVAVRGFIPPLYVHGPEPGCSYPGDGGVLYNGNNRTFNRASSSYKVHSSVTLLPGTGGALLPVFETGFTKRYASNALTSDGLTLREDTVLHDCFWLDDQGQAQNWGMAADVSNNGPNSITAHIHGSATNPLTPPALTPTIDWDMYVNVDATNPAAPTYTISGTHDCFPAWETYIGFKLVDSYTPPDYSPATIAYCLGGGSPTNVYTSGSLP